MKLFNIHNFIKLFFSFFFKKINTYESLIIKDGLKYLDRLALVEANYALLINPNYTECCLNCWKLSENSAEFLAKCLTYEDLKILRFNFDFGLGVYTGLELMSLPQGEVVRADIIERYKSSSSFFSLMILLCQNSNNRINLIIKLLDCALHLFENLRNLFAFAYLMEAFEHIQVKIYKKVFNRMNFIFIPNYSFKR